MNILVTGGAGFIGSHLCLRLLNAGHQVLCVDNLLTGTKRNIEGLCDRPGFTFLCRDVSEPTVLDDLKANASAHGLHAIFHLASPASPIGYWTYPVETIRVNSEGTRYMLALAKHTGARMLFSSTSEAYGDPLVHPQVETYWGNVNSLGVRACYDESKRLGETLVMEFYRRFGVDARIVRIFNTYGPNNRLDDGRMIPNFVVSALTGDPIIIHGTGEQTRCLCYVDDLVEGLLRALFTAGTAGEVYNLGSTLERTVLEWAHRVSALVGAPTRIIHARKREDDPERRRPNIEKAQAALGWQPDVCPEDGLARTIAWARHELEYAAAVVDARPVSHAE